MPETRMEELAEDECRRLLAERHLGRLAVFRTDPGSNLDAAAERELVAFEVDAADEATRTGWSVVVRGSPGEVTDLGDLERLRAMPLYPWAPGEKARYVCVRPISVTGRRIRIPDDLPFTWWG